MQRPGVGIAVFVARGTKILMLKRQGSHGAGTWSFPGGHLEFGESWETCAKRELKEETGLDVSDLKFTGVTNDIFQEKGKHYITIFLRTEIKSDEPKIMEPDKCAEMNWFEWENMPKSLFLPIINLKKQGFHPFKKYKNLKKSKTSG